MQQEAGPEFVQSLARGLAVIRAFDAEHPEMTLSEIARATELSRASARRFLLTLVELGYLRSDGKVFALTPQVLELGFRYLSGLSLPQLAQPHLEALSQRLGESTSAAVLDDDEVVYLARVPTRRIMAVTITIGTRFPAAVTSLGRVLLAAQPLESRRSAVAAYAAATAAGGVTIDTDALLADIALTGERGWALVDQELEQGLRSVAAPVRDAAGRVVAAVNVSTSTTRTPREQLEGEYLPALLETAARISADLAHL